MLTFFLATFQEKPINTLWNFPKWSHKETLAFFIFLPNSKYPSPIWCHSNYLHGGRTLNIFYLSAAMLDDFALETTWPNGTSINYETICPQIAKWEVSIVSR